MTSTRVSLFCLLFALPVIGPYIPSVLALLEGKYPTFFIHYDQPYYATIARAYFADGLSLLVGNPYAEGSPEIYFQPHLFVYGLLMKITQIRPDILQLLIGVPFVILSLRALYQIIEQRLPKSPWKIHIWLLVTWGGRALHRVRLRPVALRIPEAWAAGGTPSGIPDAP